MTNSTLKKSKDYGKAIVSGYGYELKPNLIKKINQIRLYHDKLIDSGHTQGAAGQFTSYKFGNVNCLIVDYLAFGQSISKDSWKDLHNYGLAS